MRIVEQLPEQENLIMEIDVDSHVQSVSEITEDKAANLITPLSSRSRYFDKPLTGNVYLTYPLSKTVEVKVKNIRTIGSLLWKVAKAYQRIYKQEEASANVKTIPADERVGLINRNETDGNYGIWGHDLCDLWFESVGIYEDNKGNIIIRLSIGS